MIPISAEAEAIAYQEAVLGMYLELPDTPLRASVPDHNLARRFFACGVPLHVLETALLLGSLRRFVRPLEAPRLPPIRSLAYFQPIVAELLETPVPDGYRAHLKLKMQHLRTVLGVTKRRDPFSA